MKNVLEWLEKTEQLYPDKVAFRDPFNACSYKELLEKSRVVGSYIAKEYGEKRPVIFFMEKSVLATCGMFGVIYARDFYSFMDLRQPKERMLAIASKLNPILIFTDRNNEQLAKEVFGGLYSIKVLEDIFEDRECVDIELLERLRRKSVDIDPLYVNFTSGSTGEPKGVVVCHRSVIDFINEFVKTFDINENDVFANQAPFDFDVSVKDIYSSIYVGTTVAMIPRDYFSNPTKLMDYLCDNDVTVLVWAVSAMCFVSIMNGFDYKVPKGVRKVIFSGEVLPIKHYKKWKKYLPNSEFINVYGPTEITCNCTYYVVDKDFELDEVMPIGVPFDNEKVFLLDDFDKEINEKNVVGEICVSGTCLALGYFKDKEKTDKAFCLNPNSKYYPERMYRTGDLGKIDDDGLFVYIGRKDNQIKHLGHRIELGEIETAITSVKGVERACCLYDFDKKKIIALYVGEVDKNDIDLNIKTKIPKYMMPNKTIRIDEMPITKNGKIDRQYLKKEYL